MQDILQVLKQTDSFVSGTALSIALGISRAAVWKRIKVLRKKGFIIEAVPSKGYRLVATPELSAEDIHAGLHGSLWENIITEVSVDSTNTRASLMIAEHPHTSGTVVVADTQEAGKGRLGRKWLSPGGKNIYMSLIIRPGIAPRDAPFLTIIAAVAAALALSRSAGPEVRIKWPNDLLVRGKKLGGILTEIRSDPDSVNSAIIGIGINVNMDRNAFPDDIRDSATSLLCETGEYHSRAPIISEILNAFEEIFRRFMETGKESVLKEWRRLNCTLGKKVKVILINEIAEGIADDIDDNGRLIIKSSDGGSRTISAGDICFLR